MPLLQPEIRTYLWWPGEPPFGYRLFHHLLNVADQLIVDSAQFDSPGFGLAELARLSTAGYGINDFNWARLTPWREIIAQFFDGTAMLPYLENIRSVRLEFGRSDSGYASATAGLLLLLGWFGRRLGWEPETTLDRPPSGDITMSVLQGSRLILVELVFCDHGRQAAGRLMTMEIVSQPADRAPAKFRVVRDDSLANVEIGMRIHDQCEIDRVIPLGVKSDDALLEDELELAGTDTLYSQVVLEASRLAGREVWVPA
ncbi:MAG: hypothetical protein NVS9B15_24600 [Acidobacteriaceae bacterium]